MSNSDQEKDFRRRVREELGLQLTEHELRLLFTKWCAQQQQQPQQSSSSSGQAIGGGGGGQLTSSVGLINEGVMSRDLVEGMRKSQAARFELQSFDSGHQSMTFDEIVRKMASAFTKREKRISGDNLNYKAYLLLTEGRATTMSRSQLASAAQYRLNLTLLEENIETIFRKLDPNNTGLIKAKHLIDLMLEAKRTDEAGKYEFEIKDHHSRNLSSKSRLKTSAHGQFLINNADARSTYDHHFVGVSAPPEELCPPGMTVTDLEKVLKDKISDRTHKAASIYQTIRSLFGDMRSSLENKTEITYDQLKFTLLKKFQLLVPESLLVRFFQKYDPSGLGYIGISAFVQGVIKSHEVNDPLIDEHPLVVSSSYRPSVGGEASAIATTNSAGQPTQLLDFLAFVRKQIRIVTNEEGRAPTYLLSGCNRMTVEQAVEYFHKKIRIRVEREFMEKLQSSIYNANGLVDMRRLMKDAMSIQDGGVLGADQSLVKGGVVTVDRLPKSLQGQSRSPQVVVDMLLEKLFERMRNDHPLSNLHKVFLAAGDTRTVDKNGIRQVLSKYDIILSEEDLDSFMQAHERGDGKIDVRAFVTRIMSQETKHKNALLPKDSKDLELQFHLSKALTRVTGQRRVVQGLTGPSGTVFQGNAVEKVFQEFDDGDGNPSSSTQSLRTPRPPATASPTAAASPRSLAEDRRTVPYVPFASTGFGATARFAAATAATAAADDDNNNDMGNSLFSSLNNFSGLTSPALKRPSTAPAGPPRRTFERTSQTSTTDRFDPAATVIQISSSPSRPKTAAPTHARGGGSGSSTGSLSPRDMRSPRTKYVYTGQPRKGGIGCYEALLRKRMKTQKESTREQQSYGLFVKQLSRMIKMQQKQQQLFENEVKRGTLNPQVIKRR